uniref:Mucin-4-like isoform X2 n=1 Tax=Petromyzon marinus TaxID=7757 RepID=A0AAJ7THF5_PETMA|nr:mucin-4-like isoform X2 [Petromyzon marinus]
MGRIRPGDRTLPMSGLALARHTCGRPLLKVRSHPQFTDNGAFIFQDNRHAPKFPFPNPPSSGFQSNSANAIIAVFWDDADLSAGIGNIFYQEYNLDGSQNLVPDIVTTLKNVIARDYSAVNAFQPSWILKVTWDNVPAVTENDNPQHTNTFQAILATDGVFSFCLSIFQHNSMKWQPLNRDPNLNKVVMGYHTGIFNVFYNDPIMTKSVAVRYSPDSVVGNTGQMGTWLYRLETNSITSVNSKRDCLRWVNTEQKSNFWFWNPCPCSYWQGRLDSTFINGDLIQNYNFPTKQLDGMAYTLQSVWQNPDGSGVRCYYDWRGSLITGQHERLLPTPWNPPNNPWWFSDYNLFYYYYNVYFTQWLPREANTYKLQEVQPYTDCCVDSGDSSYCSLYYEKRPADSCWGYRPPRFGWMYGDPHITTMDGLGYTFNGLGEYDLLIADNGNGTKFRIQGRTQRAGFNHTSMATSFVALVAWQLGSPVVEWKLNVDNTTSLYLNGVVFNVKGNLTTINGTTLMATNGSLLASFSSGASVTVTATVGALQFLISLPETMRDRTTGLLGVFNGNKTDDFQASNGTILPFDGTTLPSESRIFYEFGSTWKVTSSSSLFQYGSGESWDIFNNNNFVPTFYEQLLSESKNLDTITSTCKGNQDCIFDVLSTGDLDFGKATVQASDTFMSENKIISNSPPNITGRNIIQTRLNEASSVQLAVTDPNGDNVNISITPTSPDLNISNDGLVTWRPTSSKEVFARVVATDGGLAPTLMALSLTLCNCSAKSTCLYSEPLYSVQHNQSTFQVAGCNCSDGYTGQFCEMDVDACVTNPCYPGINCTDLPPPSLGYKCGPCPAGYTGDGEKCLDIDECNVMSPCGGHGNCSNSPGSFSCSCFPGYRDPPICRDIDECAENKSICNNATENCLNQEGNYSCNPKPGLPGNKPPTINGSTEVKARLNESTILQITVVDPESDPITLTITPNSSDFTIYANGSVGWRPSSTREALVWLVASDGGNSSRVALSLTVCNCNRNAACNFSQPQLSNSNDSPSFQVASCLCSSGYAGTYCDQDYDACGESPCFTGVTCTDLPAPSLNFTCGPCPVGYSGNGRSCLDVDECDGASPCGGGGNCTNSPGSFTCTCLPGYRGYLCMDVDECVENPNVCTSSQNCMNTLGGFLCTCKLGTSGSDCTESPCPGLSCPQSYCDNNGTCSINTATCKQQCSCGDSYKGDNCQNGKEIIQATLRNTDLKAKYRLVLEFLNENYRNELNDTTSDDYTVYAKNHTKAVADKLSVIEIYDSTALAGFSGTSGSQLTTVVIASFKYTSQANVLTIYNGTLEQRINGSFSKNRVLEPIHLKNLTVESIVPRDVLLNYYSCDTVFKGYVVTLDSAQGVICKSPCSDTNYCKNGGTCQHLATGVQCTCPANFNGQLCENDVTGVSRGVFFGVLFGVLGGLLLLLLLGLLAFCLCKKQKNSLNSDKHGILRSSSRGSYVPWLTSISNTDLGSKHPVILKSWKARQEPIDITKIVTKRPTAVHPEPGYKSF